MIGNFGVFGSGGIIKIDNYTFTSGGTGDWCVVKPKSDSLYSSVKTGLGSGAFLSNIDATVYQVEMILLSSTRDAKFLNDLYEEQVLAITQSDATILNKLHTMYATNDFLEFTGKQGKIENRTNLLTISAQGSEDNRSTIKFTLTFINGLLLHKQ